MKLTSILSTSLFAAMAVLSISAQAASDTDKAAEVKAPAENVKPVKPASQKRHSHLEEKTGVPQSMPEATSDKPNAAKDMSKHYHPQDGK